MKLDEYRHETRRTAGHHDSEMLALVNWSMGLAGETGEFVDHVKKAAFHATPLDMEKVEKELGDILWYWARAVDSLGLSADHVARKNLDKLRTRYPDGFNFRDAQARRDLVKTNRQSKDGDKV